MFGVVKKLSKRDLIRYTIWLVVGKQCWQIYTLEMLGEEAGTWGFWEEFNDWELEEVHMLFTELEGMLLVENNKSSLWVPAITPSQQQIAEE